MKKNNLSIFKKIIIILLAVIIFTIVIIALIKYKQSKEDSIFTIRKTIVYSSADVESNSNSLALENLNICQFSDLSIYINNGLTEEYPELTNANTIKELYIDNISIFSALPEENLFLNYKSPLNFGKYINLYEPENNRIDFNIINNNDENQSTNYDSPTFYTDCSNPISLGYINKNVLTDYSISDSTNKVYYNGKVFKDADVNLEYLGSSLNFVVHIVNNLNHKFKCTVSVDLDFGDDFLENGYSYLEKDLHLDDELHFVREKE